MKTKRTFGKEVSINPITFYQYKDLKKGFTVEGRYIETRIDQFDKPSYKFKTDDGGLFVFNSSADLDGKMANIPLGMFVRLTYQGQRPTPGGKFKGKLQHVVTVEPTDDIDTTQIATESTEATAPTGKAKSVAG